jgi:cyclohexyl-isocyanide hydratase
MGEHVMDLQAPLPSSGVAPLEIGMLLYPGMTLLDLAGPQAALGLHGRTHLFWKTLDPVMTDGGVALVPTATFADAPAHLDVLFVPGGFGTVEAMKDEQIIAFLAARGRDARYVTSVCSGSLLLGMAGLLDGYRAATHWACYDALEAMGVQPVHERVVADRNRLTGGGVTAGIDFGLTLLAELRGVEVAKLTQLMMEYDPAPPFNTGHPRVAGPGLTAAALGMMGTMSGEAIAVAGMRRGRAAA